ncbi:hypothetical protein mRhiFer1_009598 [Rhinolophus ferrumequinum]|uniref:Uncharacterized protein n=1 Tax=Rhinolophus ferrumequinum TaxID=59479 RepID=A0A7J7ZQ27_RHIFE|nr:hypothetical protein mRhiFer1_009598 [Rhinolophus ferrumequinum]
MRSSSGFAGQHPAFRGAAGGGRQGAASRSARLGGFPAAQAQDAACRAGGRRKEKKILFAVWRMGRKTESGKPCRKLLQKPSWLVRSVLYLDEWQVDFTFSRRSKEERNHICFIYSHSPFKPVSRADQNTA